MAKRAKRKNRAATVTAPRTGLPSPDSVRAVTAKIAPTGFRFRILKTTETDAYDKPKAPKGRRP